MPTALITGSSSGIGAATARRFLAAGWNVAATMRAPAHAPPWTRDPRCLVPALDVADRAQVDAAVEQTVAHFGRVDVLVNNAGYGLTGPLEGLTAEQLRRQFDVNVLGLIAVTQAVLPHLRAQRSGVVVNVSSIGGRAAFPLVSAYHATKFAVEGLSESLRFELRKHGVRVKLVEPGGIRTDFITRSQEWGAHPAYEPELSNLKALTVRLNERLPGPEPVADVVFRAATDGSDRLRYPAKAGPYLAVKTLLPDALWRRLAGAMLSRHAQT